MNRPHWLDALRVSAFLFIPPGIAGMLAAWLLASYFSLPKWLGIAVKIGFCVLAFIVWICILAMWSRISSRKSKQRF
jgi:tellurite resistance protein TehA-like permease